MKLNKLFSLIILCLFITSPLAASIASFGGDVIVNGEFVITDTTSYSTSTSPSDVYFSAFDDEDLSLQADSYTRSMLITEVGTDQIELQNNVASVINVSDYTLELTYGDASMVTIETNEVVEIAAGAYYVINTANSNLNASTIDLNEGILELRAGSGSYQDIVSWGHLGKAPAIPVGSSISRSSLTPFREGTQTEFVYANDWSISTSTTFGAANNVVASELGSSSVILSELFLNGTDGFIELINIGNESVNIEDYTLYVNSTLVHTFASQSLGSSSITSIDATDAVLTPTGNMYLYNSSGARVCQMGWNDLLAGFSFSRFLNFSYDYAKFDDIFTYDITQFGDYRKIEIDKYDWDYDDGFTSLQSGFSYSEPSRDEFNVNTIQVLATNYSAFNTVRQEDVENWLNLNLTDIPVIASLNVSIHNNGSLTVPYFTLHNYFDAGFIGQGISSEVKLPLFNWTNIEYEVTDFAPGDWFNVTILIATSVNGTGHNINFVTIDNIVTADSYTLLNVTQAKAKVEGFFNPTRYESGDEFIANVTLTNEGTYIAENITFTLRPYAIDSFGTNRLQMSEGYSWSHYFGEELELDIRETVDVSFGFTGVKNVWDPVKFIKIKFEITFSTKDLGDDIKTNGYLKVFILSPSFFNPYAWENPYSFVIWVLTGIFSMWWVSRWFYRASKAKPRPEPTEYVYPDSVLSEMDD
ncbi:MAG: hypothetical protein ACTSYA_01070 [Candidatus Kariarchaeaceae archaeon]